MNIRWNQVAVAAAVGVLIGAFFSDFYHMHIKPRPPKPAPRPMETLFTQHLKVPAPQWEKISVILEKYQPEIEKIQEESRPRIDAVRARMKSELKTLLTPEQAARLEELEKEFAPGEVRLPRPR